MAKNTQSPDNQGGGQLDPEIGKFSSVRSLIFERFGRVVTAMMSSQRYSHQTISDLQQLVLEPLMCDHIAIAERSTGQPGADEMVGVAIWASVSEEVDARIREQINNDIWPLRLRSEDWNSGSINWLIDVITPDRDSAASVIANMTRMLSEGVLKLHPVIASLVDEDVLRKMGAHNTGEADASSSWTLN